MAKRRSIHIEGFKHSNPIPVATRLGPLLVSSVIVGTDPATGKVPDSIEEQCVHLFRHVRAMLAAAGATPEDVAKMEFWVPDRSAGRAVVNQEWAKMFPDLASCPSRHTHLGSEPRLQASFMAYIDSE
ncbi:MAG TPA: RidA family protein [Stellaceae bacterium]|jgi:enamine deaminase RidA (YjgF/YER057c/UK114 family)|nr:RidA family protein [Stellaceae bacterium]